MNEEPETFESIVADYGRAVDAREAASARAEELERKAATGLAEFRAIRLRGAERARSEAQEYEAEVLRIIDRLEMLQRQDAAVPRLNDTAALAAWRGQLREAREGRAHLARATRTSPADRDVQVVHLQSLDDWAALLIGKIRQAEIQRGAAENTGPKRRNSNQ